jgi:hypothetical protein
VFTAAYALGAVLGNADSWCTAAFRVLALGFLGMDWRRGSVRIPLYSGIPNAAEWNGRRVPLAVTVRDDTIASTLAPLHKLKASQSSTVFYMDYENNVFTDSRESTMIVNTPRIVPNGTKRHSIQPTTNANQ